MVDGNERPNKRKYQQLSQSDGDNGSDVDDELTFQLNSEEIVVPDSDRQNWRGIGISLLVIVAICSIIALAILLLTPKNQGEGLNGERFYLSEIVDGEYTPRIFNGSWVADDQLVYRDSEGHLILYSVRMKAKRIIVRNTTFGEFDAKKYSVSADLQYVLLIYDIYKIFRHSFVAKYKIYNVSSRQVITLKHPESSDEFLRYAAWGPIGNQLVYVYDNNVYYLSSISDTHHVVTTNGVSGLIFNGVPDWLYEEEILSSNNAIWWSKNGNFLCFASFNDTKVGTFHYNWYGDYRDANNIYPKLMSLRYPKVGGENPIVTLWMADVKNPKKIILRDVKPPREVQDQDHYFTSVTWLESHSLAVIWMPRSQNFSVVTLCTGSLWYCSVVFIYRPLGKGWADLYDPIVFGAGGRHWFLKLPFSEGESGYFRHVAVLDNMTKHLDFLTQGKFDITKILTYHPGTSSVYFLSTKENRPGERHLYAVVDRKSKPRSLSTCLTCDEGEMCLYNNAIFSPSSEYYIYECLGPGIPQVEIRSVYNSTFEVLDSNADLAKRIDQKMLPQVRTFQVPIKEYKAQVRLFLPPGLEDDEAISYPLVVFVYGGPGSQLVSEKFELHWGTYLAGRKNYIYAWIDGRGSGFQGDKMLHELYHNFGNVEVLDQIEITRYLRDNLPFINRNHIAIWGWSYGGYVAASALASENTIFKCGISVAPVTNWLYYDTAYTERYMGSPLPQDNYLGYEKCSLMKKAAKFKGKKLLLVHGTADDNVHIQHSTMLMKALNEAKVLFQSQIYPDESHSLSNVKNHLYRTMEDFLSECFFVEKREELEATKVKKDVKGR